MRHGRSPFDVITALVVSVSVGCGDAAGLDDPTTPDDPATAMTGSMQVHVLTTGIDIDEDGYVITVEGAASRELTTTGTVTYAALEAGDYEVALTGLAGNCAVMGSNPRGVSVVAGDTAMADFSVACTAITGAIAVRTVTTGASLDADGYTFTVDDSVEQPIAIRDFYPLPPLEPGDHEVTLTGVAPNCEVDGATTRTIELAAGATVRETFEVTCAFVPRPVAFSSDRGDNVDVYAMHADGMGLVRLTSGPLRDEQPAWSPDGAKIALSRSGVGLTIMEAGGSSPVSLTDGFDAEPAWSPDGAWIAFTREETGWFDFFIWVVRADGTDPARIDSLGGFQPAWSPDGSKIALSADGDIHVMDTDGSNRVNLTDGPDNTFSREPAWSPDGTQIAYTRWEDGNAEIYVMDADGSNPINLTTNSATDAQATWSPDGTKIAFVTNRDGNGEIYVMNADGSDPMNVTNHPASDWAPAWGPQLMP
jgi:Tol biopolymer transport system component